MVRIGLGLGWLDLDCREAVMSSQFASLNFQSKGSAGLTESQVFDIIWVPRGLTAAWAKQMCSTKTVNCQLPDVQNDIFLQVSLPQNTNASWVVKLKSNLRLALKSVLLVLYLDSKNGSWSRHSFVQKGKQLLRIRRKESWKIKDKTAPI